MTWLIINVFLDYPYYDPVETLIRLKTKLVDQFLFLLVFFYGIVNWKEALWLLKALIWVVIIGCLVTVVDTYNIPDLGVITERDTDGRVEGILGSAPEFGGLLAFMIPAMVALWWTEIGVRRLLVFIGVGSAMVSLLLTATRGDMLGLAAGTIMAAIYLRRYLSAQLLARATMALLIFAAVAVTVVLSTDFGDLLVSRLSTGLATGDVQTLSSGRTAFWSAALDTMAQHPLSFITGLGWEAYFQTIGHHYATHSVYVDRLYNLGSIGLALFVLCFANAMAIARRALRSASAQAAPFLMALVVGIISFMIAMAFADIEGAAPYVWACAGLGLRIAVSSPEPQGDDRPWSRDHA